MNAFILTITQGFFVLSTGFATLDLAQHAQTRAIANGATTATITAVN